MDPQLSRTSLENVLPKEHDIAQNCTTMIVVVTTLYWAAVSPPEEDLQPIVREEAEIAIASMK